MRAISAPATVQRGSWWDAWRDSVCVGLGVVAGLAIAVAFVAAWAYLWHLTH